MINSEFLEMRRKDTVFEVVGYKEKELLNYPYDHQIDFINYFWEKFIIYKNEYKEKHGKNPNNRMSGEVFEMIITYLLTRENIRIKTMDSEIDGLRDVEPDFILIKPSKKEIFLSLKTSLRERWKQADWEALKYKKYICSNIKCILLVKDSKELKNLKTKIEDPSYELDLDHALTCNREDIEELFKLLKK